jgi:hypothetical protein
MYRPRGMTDAGFFQQEWPNDSKKFVATASKSGVFYAVYEIDAAQEPSLVPDANGKVRLAMVVLTRRAPKSEYNFGYKDMTEFSGPCEADCPERLLELLSPFRREAAFAAAKYSQSARWAANWRARCWTNVAKRKDKLKLKHGMQVKLPKAVTFGNGATLDTFMVEQRPGKRGFLFANGYYRYRLTKAMQLDLTAA